MSFASFSFLFLLAAALLARILLGPTKRERPYLIVLVCLSLVFYGWHVPAYLGILLFSTLVDYTAGGRIAATRNARLRRLWLVASLATNLGLLAFFKYSGWLTKLWSDLTGLGAGPYLALVLPMGISFYTFQSMSYTIDVYRGIQAPVDRFWQFLLYVSFFPQLVAGPIVRARDFIYQIGRRRGMHVTVTLHGVYLIIRGFFLKLCLADNLGSLVDGAWDGAAVGGDGLATLTLALLFGAQIFCDFAGYSSIARGIGYLLGFRIPINFDAPYLSITFSEFWRRWHITLSQWLRDYLYIPLGGNRKGRRRTYFNLAMVMTLGGLWHGAANHFVVWGMIHGAALAVERLLGWSDLHQRGRVWQKLLWFAVVQTTVFTAWVFFRATGVSSAMRLLSHLVVWPASPESLALLGEGLVYVLPAALLHLRTFATQRLGVSASGPMERSATAAVMLYFVVVAYGRGSEFIYFQF